MSNPWPVVTQQTLPWVVPDRQKPQLDIFTLMRLDREYQAAVVPPIAEATPFVDPSTMSLVEAATVAMARFDDESAGLPVPMPAVLLRSEAASSSQIEQISVNARNLAMSVLGLSTRHNATLVAANTLAMQRAIAQGSTIDSATIRQIHSTLLSSSQPELAGAWRQEPVWIGTSSLSPHDADYVPPPWPDVPAAIDDLCSFAGRADLPVLVQAAILHAQFETIHPFPDGNGRVGRTLIHALLKRRGLAGHSTVPISAGLLGDLSGYVRALTAYREGDPTPIIRTVAQAGVNAVANGRRLASEILEIRRSWIQALAGTREDSSAWPLADMLFAQPVVTVAWVSRELGVSDVTATRAIRTLVEAGVLTQSSSGRRNRVWQASAALAAIDAFASRSPQR